MLKILKPIIALFFLTMIAGCATKGGPVAPPSEIDRVVQDRCPRLSGTGIFFEKRSVAPPKGNVTIAGDRRWHDRKDEKIIELKSSGRRVVRAYKLCRKDKGS